MVAIRVSLAALLVFAIVSRSAAQDAAPQSSAAPSSAPAPPSIATAPPPHRLEAEIEGLRNSNGKVRCALWNSPQGFAKNDDSQFATASAAIDDQRATCVFNNLPAGSYAIAVLHDENGNGRMDYDFLGLPKEGYGFSNDAKALLSAPPFPAAEIKYDGVSLVTPIRIHY